jgi:hypothetical protein
LYLGIYQWPLGDFYLEGLKNKVEKIYLLSDTAQKALPFEETYSKELYHHRLKISLPLVAPDTVVSVVVVQIEGEPEVEPFITQQQNGIIQLPGVLATATKNNQPVKLNFNSSGGGAAKWTDTAISLIWSFKVEKPGTYQVDIVTAETGSHGSPVWHGDQIVEIASGNQHFRTKIVADSKEFNPRTVYWQKIHTRGSLLVFKKPGTFQLSLDPVEFPPGQNEFTFRAINLVPVKK